MRSTSAQVKTDAEALCGGKDSTMYLLGSGLEIALPFPRHSASAGDPGRGKLCSAQKREAHIAR